MVFNRVPRCAPAAFAAALISSSAVAQGCIKPAVPGVPDKSNMDAATRNAVTAQIDAYIAATNVYLACLEQSDAIARAEVQRIIDRWSAPAVTDIQVVTD